MKPCCQHTLTFRRKRPSLCSRVASFLVVGFLVVPSSSFLQESNRSQRFSLTSYHLVTQGVFQSENENHPPGRTSLAAVEASHVNRVVDRTSTGEKRRRKTQPLPITGYDAQAIEEYYDRSPIQVGWRLNILGFPLLGWYIGLLFDRAIGMTDSEKRQRMRGEELRHHLVNSGSVALIKSGQALSLRPDIIRNPIWAEELGKLVDAVGKFSDLDAMKIMKQEMSDLYPRLKVTKGAWKAEAEKRKQRGRLSRVQKFSQKDPLLSLFEFENANEAVASASIGQVYKARIRPGAQLEAAIGKQEAARWGGKVVAIKVQRPDVEASAAMDMYLLRKTAKWLSKFRGGDLPAIADQFGMQLYGELDYVREADNCERFRELYGSWNDVYVPAACLPLTRKKVLVMEWVDGEKGPWPGDHGLYMVSVGLRCSVDQLMSTGLFHADPHRGNMLETPAGKLSFIDFGMMADIDEESRYGLFGLVIGLQTKDLPLVTENLLKLGFLEDTTQLDQLVPRLRAALMNSTGGTGKASDVNFARLQAELDNISRENVLRFSTPPFFTIIIRSLTMLEGVAQSVDPNFKLVRGAYPYVLRQLLRPSASNEGTPAAVTKLLTRLLTVQGEGKEIEWERLRDFLQLAQKASKTYKPSEVEAEGNNDRVQLSRKTIEMFVDFLTSRTGLFLKKPLVHELAEAIDGLASMGEANLVRTSGGLLPVLPGMNGPINTKRIDEIQSLLETVESALVVETTEEGGGLNANARLLAMVELAREMLTHMSDVRLRENAGPILAEMQSVVQMVAVEVLEIRGARAMRSLLNVGTSGR